jgi:DNA-binding NarL/FixJ family response regulator
MEQSTLLAPDSAPKSTLAELARAPLSSGFELGRLWRELASGRWKVASLWNDAPRVYAHVKETPESERAPLTFAEHGVLRRILLGEPQKSIALSTGHSCSAISATNHRALARLGVHCCLWDVPVVLFMAAHEAHGLCRPASAGCTLLEREGPPQWVVSTTWPDSLLQRVLAPAELAVIRLLFSGHAHLEIARLRHASVRTVANQLNSAYRKAGVSGRTQLLCKLLRHAGEDSCLHMHDPAAG